MLELRLFINRIQFFQLLQLLYDLNKMSLMLKALMFHKDLKRNWVYYSAKGNFYLFFYLFKWFHFEEFHHKKYLKGNMSIQGAFYIELEAEQVCVQLKLTFRRDICLNLLLKSIYKWQQDPIVNDLQRE